MKKQMTKFNQRRAENPFVKKVQTSVHETRNPVGEQELLKIGWNDYEELIICKHDGTWTTTSTICISYR